MDYSINYFTHCGFAFIQAGNLRDAHGSYLIDRTPGVCVCVCRDMYQAIVDVLLEFSDYFAPILHFLRCDEVIIDEGLNVEGILEEAMYFNVTNIIEPLKALAKTQR